MLVLRGFICGISFVVVYFSSFLVMVARKGSYSWLWHFLGTAFIRLLLSFPHLLERHFFAWRFILNENILFWLTISYQKLFVFPVSVFCSEIFALKLNLWSKVGLTYAISIVK